MNGKIGVGAKMTESKAGTGPRDFVCFRFRDGLTCRDGTVGRVVNGMIRYLDTDSDCDTQEMVRE